MTFCFNLAVVFNSDYVFIMNGKPRLACVNVPYPLSKTPVDVLTALDVYARMKGNDLAGRWA